MFTITFKLSCRSKQFNPFVNFKSMMNASYTGYNGLSVRQSLDQQSVKLRTKVTYPFLFRMNFD